MVDIHDNYEDFTQWINNIISFNRNSVNIDDQA